MEDSQIGRSKTIIMLLSFVSAALLIFSRTQTSNTNIELFKKELLETATLPQSQKNAMKVNQLIESLAFEATKKKTKYLKSVKGGTYRTIWSTVTAQDPIGVLSQRKPSSVLGGKNSKLIGKFTLNSETHMSARPHPLVAPTQARYG